MNDLQSMLKDLHTVSGLNISIFDIDEKLITSYPTKKSPFCSLIESNIKGLERCKKCDHEAFEMVKKTKELYIYQCSFHLYEAVVPIYTYGNHTGYLMMGQTLTDSLVEKNQIFEEAIPLINDPQKLSDAINAISFHSKDQIISFAKLIDICGKYLTLTNRIEAKNNNLAIEVKKYIMNNYNHEITVEGLCDYFYCSRATLINKFKNEYGTTVHQYLLDYRLKQAIELLKYNDYTINEISDKVGFSDANYFSKAFHKKFNISPSKYRSTNQETI